MKNNNLTPKQQLQLQRLLAKANNQNEKVPFLRREQNKTILTLNQLQNPIRALKAEGKWQTLSKEERQDIKQKFQQMKQNQRSEKFEKSTQSARTNDDVSDAPKNPILVLKGEGKWQTLSKEER